MSATVEHLILLIKEVENQCIVDKVANPRECDQNLISISGTIPKRASRILDALATILVSQPKSEVMAVGLQCEKLNKGSFSLWLETITYTHGQSHRWRQPGNVCRELVNGDECHHIQQQKFSRLTQQNFPCSLVVWTSLIHVLAGYLRIGLKRRNWDSLTLATVS